MQGFIACFLGLLIGLVGCRGLSRSGTFQTHRVTIPSDRVMLAGRLYQPAGSGPFPAVVLVHGSPCSTEKNLRDYARHFASEGVVALGYDKRGCGASTGDHGHARYEDLARDALAATRLLRSTPYVDVRRIGLLGVSQGGWVIMMADTLSDSLAFLINVSGPAVSSGQQMGYVTSRQVRDDGYSAQTAATFRALHQRLWQYFLDGEGGRTLRADVDALLQQPEAHRAYEDGHLRFEIDRLRTNDAPTPEDMPWVADHAFDPVPLYRSLDTPMLIIYGERDHLVDVDESVRVLREAFAAGGVEHAEVRVYPEAGHGVWIQRRPDLLFVPVFPEGYLDLLTSWVKNASVLHH